MTTQEIVFINLGTDAHYICLPPHGLS